MLKRTKRASLGCCRGAVSRLRRRWMVWLTVLLLGGFVRGSQIQAADDSRKWGLEILSELPVPEPIEWAMDVRWASEDSVLIAGGQAGVFEVPVQGSAPPEVVIGGGRGAGRFWLASRLGRSMTHWVVASPVFSFAWKSEQAPTLQETPFDVIVDLDVFRGSTGDPRRPQRCQRTLFT